MGQVDLSQVLAALETCTIHIAITPSEEVVKLRDEIVSLSAKILDLQNQLVVEQDRYHKEVLVSLRLMDEIRELKKRGISNGSCC